MKHRLGWTILLLVCALFALRGFRNAEIVFHSRDFKPVYSGAACLVSHCNPYDNVDLQRQFVARGGDLSDPIPFTPHYLGYPPDALFYIIPFTFLSWHAAHLLWLLTIIVVFLLGTIAMGDLCIPYSPLIPVGAMAFMLLSSMLPISLAQPTALVMGLLMIAVWSFVRQRYVAAGVFCFAMSFIFKPHMGALILLYFLLANASYRRRAWQVIALTVLLAVPGLVWATVMPESHHWTHDLSVSLKAVASNGKFSDPSPKNPEASQLVNLQSVFAAVKDEPGFYNDATYLTWLPLFLLWIYAVLNLKDGDRKDFLCLATIAALDMLPIYHRLYDTRLLLMTFPALALLLSTRKVLGWVMLLVSTLVTGLCSGPYFGYLRRPLSLGCMLASVAYLACCYISLREEKTLRLTSG
jgi:hypothetical protein